MERCWHHELSRPPTITRPPAIIQCTAVSPSLRFSYLLPVNHTCSVGTLNLRMLLSEQQAKTRKVDSAVPPVLPAQAVVGEGCEQASGDAHMILRACQVTWAQNRKANPPVSSYQGQGL